MPDLSIIVTAYNIERYIEQCLTSVAAQTFGDFEVLVVDDGSSDATPNKIIEFCALDSRFVPVLLAENSPGGVATAANAGLDRARGRWVGFVDGDDYVEPRMFERLVDAAVAADTDLAVCGYLEVVDGSGERRDPADAHRWAELTESWYALDVHTRRQFLRLIAVPWRKLYRRGLLEDHAIRFPVSSCFFEDNPFHWFTVVSARSIAVVPEVLCYHRVDRAGQTMSVTDGRLLQVFAHHDTIRDWLAERQLLDIYQTTLLDWVISQLGWVCRRTPPELRRSVFDTAAPIIGSYSPQTLSLALLEGRKGLATRRLTSALARGDYRGFERSLAERPSTDNPMITAAYHLRRSGLRHTVKLTRRYVRNRVGSSRITKAVRRIGSGGGESRISQDVMFGLIVIQQRLRELNDELVAVHSRLDGIEEHLAELTDRDPSSEACPVHGTASQG